jgi:hypothetical protein
MQMQPNDEAVFELKQTAPADEDTHKSVSLDDDDPDFKKPSFLAGLSGMFSRKKPDDDPDMDLSPVSETSADLDDDFPKPSFLQKLFGGIGKKTDDDDDF